MKLYGTPDASRRGSALAISIFVVATLMGIAAALMATNLGGHREQRRTGDVMRARYASKVGLSQAVNLLYAGEEGVIGSAQAPVEWAGASFYVEQDALSSELIRLSSTATDEHQTARIELVLRDIPKTIWRFGAFGKEYLHLDANARIDSYDSSEGTYASQAVNGAGSNAHAHAKGDVGSNGGVDLDQNSKVWGDAVPGPGAVATVLGNATVTGSTVPLLEPVVLPTLNLPSYPSFGSLTSLLLNTTIPSSNRTYNNVTVGVNKTLTINGPANIVMTNLTLSSGSKLIANTTGGPVTIWVVDNFKMNSNTLMKPANGLPKDLHVNLLSDNVIDPEVDIDLGVGDLDLVALNSNSKLYAMVYAPNAAIRIESNFELFGSMIARSIEIDSDARFHFDEDLLRTTATGAPEFVTLLVRDIAD